MPGQLGKRGAGKENIFVRFLFFLNIRTRLFQLCDEKTAVTAMRAVSALIVICT